MKHSGNTILITGGGSGIGRGLAEAFCLAGNQVIISGRSKEKLDSVAAENAGIATYTVDMTDASSIRALAASVVRDFPQLNVVINNAGVMMNEDVFDADDDIMASTITTNLLGPMRLGGALIPHLAQQKDPNIIFVSSGLAFVPMAMTPAYCATKAAIHSYAQSLRYQLKDSPVEVVEIVPPYVATSLMGDRQAGDPTAMPLSDFINETIHLLTQEPALREICVQRVAPLRNAAYGGADAYDKMFSEMNARVAAARSGELTRR